MNWTPAEFEKLIRKDNAKKKVQKEKEIYAKESELQRACEAYCTDNNIYWFHQKKSKRERIGTPDLLMCVDGQFIAVELKIARNKMSVEQVRQAYLIEKAGGKFAEIRSLKAFIQFLEK